MCFHCKFTGVPKDLLTPRGVQRRCGKMCFHCNRRLPATAWHCCSLVSEMLFIHYYYITIIMYLRTSPRLSISMLS